MPDWLFRTFANFDRNSNERSEIIPQRKRSSATFRLLPRSLREIFREFSLMPLTEERRNLARAKNGRERQHPEDRVEKKMRKYGKRTSASVFRSYISSRLTRRVHGQPVAPYATSLRRGKVIY